MFEQTSFDEGVALGGLRSKEEIKILISYVLKKIDQPVLRERICDFLIEDSIANYFEINQAISEMIEDEALLCRLDENGSETVTLMGKAYFRIDEVDNLIPKSIRHKALAAATRILNRERIEKSSNVSVEKVKDGFLVSFGIDDEGETLFRMSVFVTDELQVETVKKNWFDKAAAIYSSVMSELTLD